MGLAVTAQNMIDAARRMTKTETLDEGNAFCTDAELLDQLNAELAELEDVIREVEQDDYTSGSFPITLIANQSTYALGAASEKIRSVDVQWSAGFKRSARRFNEADRNRFQMVAPSWTRFGQVYYRAIGSNLEIIPTPLSAVQIYVNYTPGFTKLALGDPYDSHNLWHMAAVYGLAAYIAMADNDLERATVWEAKKQSQFERVRVQAANRITGEPATIQRVRFRDGWEE